MQQAPKKPTTETRSYNEDLTDYLIRETRVKLWASQGFKSSGSDGLYKILSEKL